MIMKMIIFSLNAKVKLQTVYVQIRPEEVVVSVSTSNPTDFGTQQTLHLSLEAESLGCFSESHLNAFF